MGIQMFAKNPNTSNWKSLHCQKIFGAAIGFLSTIGFAQNSVKNDDLNKNSYYFSPTVSILQEFTTNAKLDANNVNGYLTQISPGFRWIANSSKIKGFIDYSLDATADSDGIKKYYIKNRLNANVVLEAVEEFAFIDLLGAISTQPVSAFGQPVSSSRKTANSTEVKTFQISPYILGNFENNFDYEARYSIRDIKSDAKANNDSRIQKLYLDFKSPERGKYLRWQAIASHENLEFQRSRNISTEIGRGALIYRITPQTAVSLIAGGESTNQITLKKEFHSVFGIGAQWQPSERTKLDTFIEKRYFGNAHKIEFEHRTRKTIWRYIDIKGISNGSGNESNLAGNIFNLLDGFYSQTEADPVKRTKIVLAEIERLGLQTDSQLFNDFFRSTNTLQRTQNLSVMMLGQRSTLTLNAFRQSNKILAARLKLIDDFENGEIIFQDGLSFLVAHRLNPNTSIFADVKVQHNKANVSELKNHLRSLRLGLSQKLSRNTNLNFQLSRSLSEQKNGGYDETTFVGVMTYRF